jgi:hypothetical protein
MNYRHGDCGLIGIDKLPEGLTASKNKVLMVGSGGNDHAFTEGTFYPKKYGQTIGYFVAVDRTKLIHPDHGEIVSGKKLREASIISGVYRVVKQVEQTHSGMVPVVD